MIKQEPGKYSVMVVMEQEPDERNRLYNASRFYDNFPHQVDNVAYAEKSCRDKGLQVKVLRGVNRATKERVFKAVKAANMNGVVVSLDVLVA